MHLARTLLIVVFCLATHCLACSQSSTLADLYPNEVALLEEANYKDSLSNILETLGTLRKKTKNNIDLFLQLRSWHQRLIDEGVDSLIIRDQFLRYGYTIRYKIPIDQAIEIYLIAHTHASDLTVSNDSWNVENILGILYNIKGDHQLSEFYYKACLTSLESKYKRSGQQRDLERIGRTHNNLGFLYLWKRDYNQNLFHLNKGKEVLNKFNSAKGIASNSQYFVDRYFKLKNLDSVKYYLQVYENNLTNIEEDRLQTYKDKYTQYLGRYYQASGSYLKAIMKYKSLINENSIKGQNRFIAKNHNRIAQCFLSMSELDSANYHVFRGLKILKIDKTDLIKFNHFYEENTISELLITLADIKIKRYEETKNINELDEALNAILGAKEVFTMLRQSFILGESKLQILEDYRDLINKGIEVLGKINEVTTLNNSHKNIAENLIDEAGNNLLQSYEKERRAIEGLPEETKKELYKFQKKSTQIISSLSKTNEAFQEDSLKAELVRVRSKIIALNSKVSKAQLKINRPQIKYLLTDANVYRITNLDQEINFEKIGKIDDLKTLINNIQGSIKSQGDIKSLRTDLNLLYNYLLGGLKLPSRINVVPDGVLYNVSWPALVTDLTNKRYLIQDHDINVDYNLMIKSSGIDNKKMLAIAPDYTNSSIAELPNSKQELEIIAQHWSGTINKYSSISEKDFVSLIQNYSHLHFAGHAILFDRNSYLAINPDSNDWISNIDLSALPKTPDQVVLSACETGLGNQLNGEGVNSLARSFLNSGTSQLVYSLWTVNDQSTKQLMKYFYKEKDDDIVHNLSNAQRIYLDENIGKRIHPYYWAGFVAVNVAEEGNIISSKWYLWLGSIIIIFIILLKFRQK